MKRFILIAITFLTASLGAHAQKFTTRLDSGEQLCFQITDTTQKAVEIVRVKLLGNAQPTLPSGDLAIPSTVKYKNTVYTVVSIGESAFAGAEGLNSVSIPSSVRQIGDRAFSGCTGLQSIVFPANTPSIGENAFEKCQSLTSLSFGSDWTAVDFHLFSDSESLKEVFIPARIMRINGIKKLAALERIEVDANNKLFSSHDGLLYSKDGLTLYACPDSKGGLVAVQEGTKTILDGALRNCSKIEGVLFLSSVHDLAYDEFTGCDSLKEITFLSEVPPMTGKWNGAAVFALVAPNQYCIIQVPRKLISRYQTSLCSSEGVYETMKGAREANLSSGKLMDKSSLHKVKANS